MLVPLQAAMLRQLRTLMQSLRKMPRLLSSTLNTGEGQVLRLSLQRQLRIRAGDALQTGASQIAPKWSRFAVSDEAKFRYTVWPPLLWKH